MARTTMAELITELRALVDAGTADYTVAGSAYWTDDQLQTVLDQRRKDYYHQPLQMEKTWIGGGSVAYYDYHSAYGNWEATDGGTAVFVVEDGLGADAGTADYTADYLSGRVTFAADTGGSAYYVTGRVYDLQRAAADVWRRKASHYAATSFDFSTDNMRVNRSAVIDNCLKMAQFYEQTGGAVSVTIGRSDTDAFDW